MPAIFRHRGYRFHFYSDEGDPREPMHVHAHKDDADAKFRLYPHASVAYNHGFDARVLADPLDQVERHREEIERAWNEHFG